MREISIRVNLSLNRGAAERGSVLVIVMLIAFGLISIALYFANSMSLELRASDNRASGLSADQAIEGAARYVGYILTAYATNGAVPDLTQYQAEAVPVGNARASEQNAHFWIIGRDPSGTASSEPYFSLIDEGSKLNLNTVNSNVLSFLPNMTLDFAEAITDWRDPNGTLSLNYSQLGYLPKHSPFETVDELRLVYGATVELLAGDDLNRNGVLDANELDSGGNHAVSPGLLEYATLYSREPNFHSDGTTLTNAASQAPLLALLQSRLGTTRANQIINRQFPPSDSTGGSRGPRGSPTNAPPSATTPTATNLVDFYVITGMTATELGQIINDITFSSSSYTRGRVNINTASADVLTALFEGIGVDQSTAAGAAQQLVNYREQNPNNLTSIAWLVDTLGAGSSPVRALLRGDYITTRSFQFTADIAATGAYGRGYERVKFVFDISQGTPRIAYRQDLARLGWALGGKTRETWVTQIMR
jgi:type II secretory pathway component PulK